MGGFKCFGVPVIFSGLGFRGFRVWGEMLLLRALVLVSFGGGVQ